MKQYRSIGPIFGLPQFSVNSLFKISLITTFNSSVLRNPPFATFYNFPYTSRILLADMFYPDATKIWGMLQGKVQVIV
jgi:hypothetical protein